MQEIGQLVKGRDNPDQDLVNVGEDIPSPVQDSLTLTERAQTFLTESVPEALEELRETAFSSPESNTTPPNGRTDIDPNKQEDLVLAKNPLGDFKDAAPEVSKESEGPATPETAMPATPETVIPIIPFRQPELPDLSNQEEGLLTEEIRSPFIGETQLVQDEAETQSADAPETNLVQLGPENLSERKVQPAVLAEEPNSPPKPENPPSVPVAQTLVKSQHKTSKKPDVKASPSPVTRIVKKGDTMAKLLQDVYGSASPSTVRFVLEHNPHIVSVRRMYPGQKIMFPPLKSAESKKMVAEAEKPLVSGQDKELGSSKKIFARSSTQTEPNEIQVEAKRDPPYAVATVQEGDTLEQLVKVVYGSSHPSYIERVLEYNPKILNPKKIYPGQDIAFPKIAEEMKTQTNQSSQINSSE
jgi:nucleoid-associated protein YgaU